MFNLLYTYFQPLFRPIGENSVLETKYSKLFVLTERMTLMLQNRRPNCREILSESSSWALSLKGMEEMKEFEPKRIKYSKEPFHLSFLRIKSEKN